MKRNSKNTKALFTVIISLLLFGVIMVYDVSVAYAEEAFGGKYYFLMLQSMWALLGFCFFYFAYKTDYHIILKFIKPLFLISLALLFVLGATALLHLDIPFFPQIYGARRWILLNPEPFPKIPLIGIISLQPSELIKLTFILYLSVLFSTQLKSDTKHSQLIRFLVLLGLVVGLVVVQPDLGTAIVISAVAIIMYFASGANVSYFIAGIPATLLLGLVFILSSPYRRERFLTYLGSKSSNPYGASYHINQIMIALGSGGFMGLGFGQSRQKYQYIPEVATDSIFAIIGEELGFIGVTVLVLAFLYLINSGYKIAAHAPDRVGQLAATGITSWLAVQTFMNLSAMIHLIPLTGVPLPLISYGGSSMVFILTALGVLLNISEQSHV